VSRQETDALRAEIAQTRAELGRTIQALAERADVKSRVQQRVQHSVRQAGSRPVPWLVLAAGATAAVAVLILMRGRRRR
jgi:hypothetical protein